MTSLRQRLPRVEDPGFLALVRLFPCCVCSAPAPSQAAHIRMPCPARGKRSTGMAEKPSDRFAVPLCSDCHLDGPDAQHRIGERKFWARVGIDPFDVADHLFIQYDAARSKFMKIAKIKAGDRYTVRSRNGKLRGRRVAVVARPIPKRANPWPKNRKLRNRNG